MNEIHDFPLKYFDFFNQTFVLNGQLFKFNKRVIDLMRGDDIERHSLEDLQTYASILNAAKTSRKGRFSNVLAKIEAIKIEEEYQGRGISTITIIPNNASDLFNRLEILMTAKKEGHNSSNNEIHAILKRLLELGKISKDDYKSMSP